MSPSDSRPVHVPVMPREVLHWLQLSPGLRVLDGTVGAAGHSRMIAQALGPAGHLIGIDRDPMMLQFAAEHLKGTTCSLVRGSYADAATILESLGFSRVDRVLLDLGLSSDQLADRNRGFGFSAGGPLDMRFHPGEGPSAAELLADLTEGQLRELFMEFGEEPQSGRIASAIISRRERGQPVRTAEELESCVRDCVGSNRGTGERNPATRVFQALRIAVNRELEHVQRMLHQTLPSILSPDGVAVVLTFHSLEDRIVKNAFKGLQGWQVLTKSPVEASPAEIRLNPRSRSAKLRAARWTGQQ